MSDWFPAAIHIGGPISHAALNGLIEAILAEDGSLDDYGGPETTREAIDKALQEGSVLNLCNERARYGQFDALEPYLVKHGIHFDRHSDSYCEFDAENVFYRGGEEPTVMLADQNGDSLVRCQDVLEVLGEACVSNEARLETIRELVAPPQSTPLDPIRFTGGSP